MCEAIPRLLVVGTGGTWCMRASDTASASESVCMVAETLGAGFDFAEQFPEISTFCMATFRELLSLDSSNMGPVHWRQIADCIGQDAANYDAFVVLQGTDTLAFTAAALAFALQGLDKPVVLSGAQLNKDAVGSDAPLNVVNACRVATMQRGRDNDAGLILREVAVVFGSRIIRATRCRKFSERDLEAFDTVNVPLLGRIRLTIRIDPATMLRRAARKARDAFDPASEFDERVALLTVFPGMNPELLETVGRQCSGIVLAAFGAGNIPCSSDSYSNALGLEPAIADLVGQDIPVVVTTQCVTGQAEVGLYETGEAARHSRAIIANDMTPEAAFVKLSWLLANEQRWPRKAHQALRGGPGRIGAIRTAMLTDMAGEVTDNTGLRSVLGT